MFKSLFGRTEFDNLTASTRVVCTTQGRLRARQYAAMTLEDLVLATISDRGQPTIGEIAEELGRSVDDVKRAIKSLRGFVRPMPGDMGEGNAHQS